MEESSNHKGSQKNGGHQNNHATEQPEPKEQGRKEQLTGVPTNAVEGARNSQQGNINQARRISSAQNGTYNLIQMALFDINHPIQLKEAGTDTGEQAL